MSSPISISAKSDLDVNNFTEYSSPPTHLVVKNEVVINYPPSAPLHKTVMGFNIENNSWMVRPKEEY